MMLSRRDIGARKCIEILQIRGHAAVDQPVHHR
jgi:hypothetical protein